MEHKRYEHGYLASQVGGFAAGMLMGGLIGSMAMLLLAPQSGKKTRAKIQHEYVDLRDQVTETIEDAAAQTRGTAHRLAASAQKQAKELQELGREIA